MKTQKQQIKEYLTKGKKITPLEALNKFGCFRLAAVVYNLKAEGLKIKSENVTKQGKKFASYSVI